MTENEVALPGGRTTSGVVRIGDTVRRPLGANSEFVHRLLHYLQAQGFSAAPHFLGVDASGREVLSFLPGVVPDELGEFSDTQFAAAARLLRSFHEATAHSELAGSSEVVCHGDASPCNFVFVGGVPVALIDFDAAHPGRRQDDLGYAAWLWLAIGASDVPAEVQGMRLARFFQAYGADPTDAIRRRR